MDVTNLTALASSMANQRTGDAVGVSVLRKALDIEANTALALLNALPPTKNLPPNVGININTTA